MTHALRLPVTAAAAVLLLAACGSTPGPSGPPTASPTATPVPSPTVPPSPQVTPVPTVPTQADLQAVYAELYPPSPNGGDCYSLRSSNSGSYLTACPVTPRLATALTTAAPSGGEPICRCQAYSTSQTAAYAPGTPAGEGTITITGFGSPHVAYVVVNSAGRFLVDDIIYCSPSPHSIYPGESGVSC